MLDSRGVPTDLIDYDELTYSGEEIPYHAPSEYVSNRLRERKRLRSRDLNELQDLWRDETLRRSRERAPLFRGRVFHERKRSDD